MTKQTQVTYSIEMQFESGEKKHIPVAATSDSQATKIMRAYMQMWDCLQLNQHVNAYLCFSRSSDGQKGYLNQDGASPTGEAWSAWS